MILTRNLADEAVRSETVKNVEHGGREAVENLHGIEIKANVFESPRSRHWKRLEGCKDHTYVNTNGHHSTYVEMSYPKQFGILRDVKRKLVYHTALKVWELETVVFKADYATKRKIPYRRGGTGVKRWNMGSGQVYLIFWKVMKAILSSAHICTQLVLQCTFRLEGALKIKYSQ